MPPPGPLVRGRRGGSTLCRLGARGRGRRRPPPPLPPLGAAAAGGRQQILGPGALGGRSDWGDAGGETREEESHGKKRNEPVRY